MTRIAVLDDYAGAANSLADWSKVKKRAPVDFFHGHLGDQSAVVETLQDYDIICTMRERTAFPQFVLERLGRLKLLCITGETVSVIDVPAAGRQGITVCNTSTRGSGSSGTPELAWGLMLSLARDIPAQSERMRWGGWQEQLGIVLEGKSLGLLGLGKTGAKMARFASAFGMNVLAWSENLTAERARERGAVLVGKRELFETSDFVSLHLVLSERSQNIVGRAELSAMKPSAFLINTSRGPLVDRPALLEVLQTRKIGGAGLDVFHEEPLPDNDPLRWAPNVVLTPHLGYSVRERMRDYYADTVENVLAFLDGRPIRVISVAPPTPPCAMKTGRG